MAIALPNLLTSCCPSFRNKDLLDKYTQDVLGSYARGFVRDVVMGAALRTAANEMALASAQEAHKAEVERITAENARVAVLHAAEVQEKIAKEQQYKMVGGMGVQMLWANS